MAHAEIGRRLRLERTHLLAAEEMHAREHALARGENLVAVGAKLAREVHQGHALVRLGPC